VRWICSRCGQEHVGIPLDWAYDRPLYWEGPQSDDDWLSEDLCVWTDDAGKLNFFIRGVLYVPIVDSGQTLGYGVWSSLSRESFTRIYELWDSPKRVEEPPYFGWFSNSLPGYPETRSLPLDVVTNEFDKRPSLELHDSDHPLVTEQRDGITLERAREIAERNMHSS
jgi:hypothetical protein